MPIIRPNVNTAMVIGNQDTLSTPYISSRTAAQYPSGRRMALPSTFSPSSVNPPISAIGSNTNDGTSPAHRLWVRAPAGRACSGGAYQLPTFERPPRRPDAATPRELGQRLRPLASLPAV